MLKLGKKGNYLKDFERCTVVGARKVGLSISEIADLLGFSCTITFRVYRTLSKQDKKTSNAQQVSGLACLFDVKAQRRTRLIGTHQTLKEMGYNGATHSR